MNDQSLENRYYGYLRKRGYASAEALLSVLSVYLPYFEGFDRVLDVGCGHGEFLRLLRGSGHRPAGVDLDPSMVQACIAQGLEAQRADALAWLPTQAGSWDAIFSSNVLEHLGPTEVAGLIRASYTALRPGGMLLVAVPNAESVTVHLHEFWRDPTHVRLYNRQLLEFFLADAGFADVKSAENQAACWEGVDALLSPLNASPGTSSPAPGGGSRRRPLPPPTWRGRLWHRFTSYVWDELFGPYTSTLEEELEALRSEQARVEAAFRYLHPSREVFVYGYKPGAGEKRQPAEAAVNAKETGR